MAKKVIKLLIDSPPEKVLYSEENLFIDSPTENVYYPNEMKVFFVKDISKDCEIPLENENYLKYIKEIITKCDETTVSFIRIRIIEVFVNNINSSYKYDLVYLKNFREKVDNGFFYGFLASECYNLLSADDKKDLYPTLNSPYKIINQCEDKDSIIRILTERKSTIAEGKNDNKKAMMSLAYSPLLVTGIDNLDMDIIKKRLACTIQTEQDRFYISSITSLFKKKSQRQDIPFTNKNMNCIINNLKDKNNGIEFDVALNSTDFITQNYYHAGIIAPFVITDKKEKLVKECTSIWRNAGIPMKISEFKVMARCRNIRDAISMCTETNDASNITDVFDNEIFDVPFGKLKPLVGNTLFFSKLLALYKKERKDINQEYLKDFQKFFSDFKIALNPKKESELAFQAFDEAAQNENKLENVVEKFQKLIDHRNEIFRDINIVNIENIIKSHCCNTGRSYSRNYPVNNGNISHSKIEAITSQKVKDENVEENFDKSTKKVEEGFSFKCFSINPRGFCYIGNEDPEFE